jgi:hypothetical protein
MRSDLTLYLSGLLSGMCALRIVQLAGAEHIYARLIVVATILAFAWMLHHLSRSTS